MQDRRAGREGRGREGGTAREGKGSDGTERQGKEGKVAHVPEVPCSQVGAPLNWVQVCVYRSVHP